ncbi:hypothetical protein V6N11_016745 [Hibiscus sabdariffa]|uniref:Terpene synthase metal-binding domain-containing protein n=1 Tax=Hibiscus sabdariffa TaxID=183260 RepID=A0ABR2TVY7_9ROSI
MLSIMGDTYDSYGTIEELQLFTDAIKRWDIDCVDRLPNYMKLYYKPLLDLYREMEDTMFKEVSENYYVEFKWYHENYVPTMKEYMKVGTISAASSLLSVAFFVGMGDELTPEIFNWASHNPKIIVASSIHGRLIGDIFTHKFEQERGHCASAVECYMKEHGVSEEEAYTELKKQVNNTWKNLNYEMIFSETSKTVGSELPFRKRDTEEASHYVYELTSL